MIEQVNSSITYIADGVQAEWEYPYPYVENDDINLYVTIDDVRTKISQDSFSFDSSTKKVTFPLAGEPVVSGAYVEISRETELTQLEDSSIVAFKSNDIERIADKLTMICQDTQRMVKDAISPEGGQIQEVVAEVISVHNNSLSSHPLKEDKANKVTSISGSSTDTEYPSAKAVNTELNKKQPKTLTEAITIEGATETTVEGVLTAINNNRANKSLSNLDENGENHFANLSLSNITRTSGFRRLVEVYNNGTSWYKVFEEYDPSTGNFIGNWCEQGGEISVSGQSGTQITLLKPMANTDYNVCALSFGRFDLTLILVAKTTTYVQIAFSSAGAGNVIYRVEGYIS